MPADLTLNTTTIQTKDETPKVWTLVILGGDEFRVEVPRHPALIHQGSRTLWKFQGTEEQVGVLLAFIREQCKAHVDCFTEEDPRSGN